MQDAEDIFGTWNSVSTGPDDLLDDPPEVHLLRMKPSGKELDPGVFSPEEKAKGGTWEGKSHKDKGDGKHYP